MFSENTADLSLFDGNRSEHEGAHPPRTTIVTFQIFDLLQLILSFLPVTIHFDQDGKMEQSDFLLNFMLTSKAFYVKLVRKRQPGNIEHLLQIISSRSTR